MDPLKLYAYCRSLCPWTVLREDTLATDFCVYMLPGHARSVARYSNIPSPPDAAGLGWLLLERRLPGQALEALRGRGLGGIQAENQQLKGAAAPPWAGQAKAKPKKISLRTTGGANVRFLVKKEQHGDLRKDARLMEVAAVVNRALGCDADARRRKLRLRT